jgi:ribonuclease HI
LLLLIGLQLRNSFSPRLITAAAQCEVYWQWLRGRADAAMNVRVNRLVSKAREKLMNG